MITTIPFEQYSSQYEQWFEKHKAVFESEVKAISTFLPAEKNNGIEIGLGSGRFSEALGIKKGVEPAAALRAIALKKGIDVMDAIAEKLPYGDNQFDFVLMANSISYFLDVSRAFTEAYRVLKKDGKVIIAFIDKNSLIGKAYEARRNESVFYKQASFYSPEKIMSELRKAGFGNFEFAETLFKPLENIQSIEPVRPGYGEGSFVVVKAIKQSAELKEIHKNSL